MDFDTAVQIENEDVQALEELLTDILKAPLKEIIGVLGGKIEGVGEDVKESVKRTRTYISDSTQLLLKKDFFDNELKKLQEKVVERLDQADKVVESHFASLSRHVDSKVEGAKAHIEESILGVTTELLRDSALMQQTSGGKHEAIIHLLNQAISDTSSRMSSISNQLENKIEGAKACLDQSIVDAKTELLASSALMQQTIEKQEVQSDGVCKAIHQLSVDLRNENGRLSSHLKILVVVSVVNFVGLLGFATVMLTR